MNDLISRQAIMKEFADFVRKSNNSDFAQTPTWNDAVSLVESMLSAQPEQQWIPVKFRPMDSEEREYWECLCGYELKNEDAVMFDCPMPEDGQEILVSYRKWISTDRCEIDGGFYGLEGNGDWDGVIAWMPLPEPYKDEDGEEGEE